MKETAIVVAALVAAVIAAAAAVFFLRSNEPDLPASVVRTATVAPPLVAVLIPETEVSNALRRPVPLDILATSSVAVAPFAPGIRLKRAVVSEDEWEERRAEIEDLRTKDVRAYAIGDLLPYGSLLVGISTASADVMVADSHLIRLYADGRIRGLEDLSDVYAGAALKAAKYTEPADADQLRLALIDLRNDDPAIVQRAIDELIAGGDPAMELLIQHVDDILPVTSAEYAFPSGSGVEMRPRVSGEIVMMVLERITGQTFGDLTKEELTEDERRTIAKAWRRFLE